MHLPSSSPIACAFLVSASLILAGWCFAWSCVHAVILAETSWAHRASLHLHISSLNAPIFAIASPLPPLLLLQPTEPPTAIAIASTHVSVFIDGRDSAEPRPDANVTTCNRGRNELQSKKNGRRQGPASSVGE